MVSAACAALVMLLSAFVSPARGDDRIVRGAPPPEAFYLSLGDSNAFGLQFDRLFELLDAGSYTPEAFNSGYTDVFAARMELLRPDQQTVNLSCPGESADTMIGGGCFFTSPEPDGPGLTLHTSYDGAQLDAALSFLHAHPDQVNPITVSIGGIDVINVIADTCNFDAACVARSGIRRKLGRKLDHILQALDAAAPRAEIILVGFYNPFTVEVPGTDRLWRRYYTNVQKAAAARNGARLADVAGLLDERNVCEVTFMCSSGDAHPTDLGYRLIADEVFRAAGFGRPPAGADQHCISPQGFDLNELHDTPHQIITHFCTVAEAGRRWVPAEAWITNLTHEVIPDDYVPAAPTPIEDFHTKLVGVRYIVDVGTRTERTYTFAATEVLLRGLTWPGTDLPMAGLDAVLRPLPVGQHTVDIFVTMSADHWDGFGADPTANLLPAGDIHWAHTTFDVVPRSAR